jgi:hypothetical protein
VYVKEHHHEGLHHSGHSFEGYPWNQRSSSSVPRCASQFFTPHFVDSVTAFVL